MKVKECGVLVRIVGEFHVKSCLLEIKKGIDEHPKIFVYSRWVKGVPL